MRRFPAAHGVRFLADCDGPDPAIPFGQVLCHPDRLDIPSRTRKPTVWAVSLLGDLFHDDVPRHFVRSVLDAAVCANMIDQPLRAWDEAGPRHWFVLLTKRYERAAAEIRQWELKSPGHVGPFRLSIVLLASAWDQDSTDAACAALADLPVRWGLHMEPLLGPVDLERWLSIWDRHGEPSGPRCRPDGSPLLSWIVVGPETGPGKRPCDPAWIERIEHQCREAGVACWRKLADGPKEVPW